MFRKIAPILQSDMRKNKELKRQEQTLETKRFRRTPRSARCEECWVKPTGGAGEPAREIGGEYLRLWRSVHAA